MSKLFEGKPLDLSPEGGIRTTFRALWAIIVATAIVVFVVVGFYFAITARVEAGEGKAAKAISDAADTRKDVSDAKKDVADLKVIAAQQATAIAVLQEQSSTGKTERTEIKQQIQEVNKTLGSVLLELRRMNGGR